MVYRLEEAGKFPRSGGLGTGGMAGASNIFHETPMMGKPEVTLAAGEWLRLTIQIKRKAIRLKTSR